MGAEKEVSDPRNGDLKVWWIPQVPMKAFEVPVKSVEEATLLANTLGAYDAFQYEHNIKPDYCNAGGLVIYEDGEWVDWYDPETFADFDELRKNRA